jgi:hypothetical protein
VLCVLCVLWACRDTDSCWTADPPRPGVAQERNHARRSAVDDPVSSSDQGVIGRAFGVWEVGCGMWDVGAWGMQHGMWLHARYGEPSCR